MLFTSNNTTQTNPSEEIVSASTMITCIDAAASSDNSSMPSPTTTTCSTCTQNRLRSSDDAEAEELEQDDLTVMLYVDGLNDADGHRDDRQNADDAEETRGAPRRRRHRGHRRSHQLNHNIETPTRLFHPRARELHPSSFADAILALVDLEEEESVDASN